MTATTSPNRIAPYLSEPANVLPQPATPEAREALLTDAVFAAIAALQGLLTHSDPKVVMKAAEMILNLETTRQRHGRPVIGMERPLEDRPSTESCLGNDRRTAVVGPPQRAAPTNPPDVGAALCGGPTVRPRRTDVSNPLDVFIDKVRKELQAQEDAEGTGVIVGREQAEECARFIQANVHRTPPPPAGRGCHEDKATPAGGPGTRRGAVSDNRLPNVAAHAPG